MTARLGRIADILGQRDELAVSPIWGGPALFKFCCLGHLDIAEAMGFELEQATPQLVVVKEGQLPTTWALGRFEEARDFGRLPIEDELEALCETRRENPGSLCGGGSFGPLTVASDVLGAGRMLRLVTRDAGLVERTSALAALYVRQLALWEEQAGADFFWIAEPVASLLPPDMFERFSGVFLRRIFSSLSVPGFLHVCGKTNRHTQSLVGTGAQVLSIDYCTDIGECLRAVPSDTVVMGNVSPMLLRHGSEREVERNVADILEDCAGYRNFVLSTGCSVIDGTPDENMRVLFDLARGWSR